MERRLSVIITTYGRKFDSIERSICSVKNQTYKNIETILVDDNPPNCEYRKSVQEGIRTYPEIVYVQHEKNRGAQAARNTGVKVASGEIVAFLDDDDEWFPEKIAKQMELVKPNVGLVYCRGFRINKDTGEIKPYDNERNFKTEVTFNDLLYGDYIGTTTQAMIPKEVIENVGYFDLKQPARQDYEMWIRISKRYRCVGVDESLFKHYIHAGEQISKNREKAIKGMVNIYNKYRLDYNSNPLAAAHTLFFIAELYRGSGNVKGALSYYARFVAKLPAVIIFNGPQTIKLLKTRRAPK